MNRLDLHERNDVVTGGASGLGFSSATFEPGDAGSICSEVSDFVLMGSRISRCANRRL
jgi:hypothetical protein